VDKVTKTRICGEKPREDEGSPITTKERRGKLRLKAINKPLQNFEQVGRRRAMDQSSSRLCLPMVMWGSCKI